MTIIFWVFLTGINGALSVANYKVQNYKSAMLGAFTCGLALAFGIADFFVNLYK